jgi:hypothetical protein
MPTENQGGEPMNAETGAPQTAAEIKAGLIAEAEKNKGADGQQQPPAGDAAGQNNGQGSEQGKDDEDKGDEGDDVLDKLFEEEQKEPEKQPEDKKSGDIVDPEKKGDEEKQDEEDDISAQDEELISKVIDKRLEPFKAQAKEAEVAKVNASFDNFIETNPHFDKYKDNIKPYVAKLYEPFVKTGVKLGDGSLIRIPEAKFNDFVTAFILGKGMLKIGAQMHASAGNKAAAGSQAAGGYRKTDSDGAIPDVTNMNKEEFANFKNRVMQGNFKA